jgi:hypothetical protein
MQNNVDELFSLIRFLKVAPYSSWNKVRSHRARSSMMLAGLSVGQELAFVPVFLLEQY